MLRAFIRHIIRMLGGSSTEIPEPSTENIFSYSRLLSWAQNVLAERDLHLLNSRRQIAADEQIVDTKELRRCVTSEHPEIG